MHWSTRDFITIIAKVIQLRAKSAKELLYCSSTLFILIGPLFFMGTPQKLLWFACRNCLIVYLHCLSTAKCTPFKYRQLDKEKTHMLIAIVSCTNTNSRVSFSSELSTSKDDSKTAISNTPILQCKS